MLEILVLIIGIPYIMLSNIIESTNTEDKDDYSTHDRNSNKQNRNKALHRKFDNLTTYEIDGWLKDRNLYDTYGSYSRETKINKILERNNK